MSEIRNDVPMSLDVPGRHDRNGRADFCMKDGSYKVKFEKMEAEGE